MIQRIFKTLRSIRCGRIYSELKENLKSPKRAVIGVIAVIFVAIGLLGIFVPLLPGIVILAPALILLSIYSPSAYAFLKRRTQKHPRLQSMMDRVRNKAITTLHRKG